MIHQRRTGGRRPPGSHLGSWGRPLACGGGGGGVARGEAAGGGVAVGGPGAVVEVPGSSRGVVAEVADGCGPGDGEGGGDGLAVEVGAGEEAPGGVLVATPPVVVGAASVGPRELQLETTPTGEE
ncbi:glycine-rich protein DOT1-like [Rhodamnia argentea]|uniref:Glycine-rich protein DOT1-like n=1 Tax=Rhodamnia argentea TaxID=178133 RepID=A0ABM3H4D4_9MYRT|nr:glycine-rich protein DOT1-like [Rhodamnia argentea]